MPDQLLTTSLKWLTKMFTEAVAAGRPMTVEPEAAATFALGLDMACTRLEEIDQLIASDDRLRRELRIAQAEINRLRQAEMLGFSTPRSGPFAPPSAASVAATLRCFQRDRREGETTDSGEAGEADFGSNVVSMVEVFLRERATAGRPVPPEGGAA